VLLTQVEVAEQHGSVVLVQVVVEVLVVAELVEYLHHQ